MLAYPVLKLLSSLQLMTFSTSSQVPHESCLEMRDCWRVLIDSDSREWDKRRRQRNGGGRRRRSTAEKDGEINNDRSRRQRNLATKSEREKAKTKTV